MDRIDEYIHEYIEQYMESPLWESVNNQLVVVPKNEMYFSYSQVQSSLYAGLYRSLGK